MQIPLPIRHPWPAFVILRLHIETISSNHSISQQSMAAKSHSDTVDTINTIETMATPEATQLTSSLDGLLENSSRKDITSFDGGKLDKHSVNQPSMAAESPSDTTNTTAASERAQSTSSLDESLKRFSSEDKISLEGAKPKQYSTKQPNMAVESQSGEALSPTPPLLNTNEETNTISTISAPEPSKLTCLLDDLLNGSSIKDITTLEGHIRSMFAHKYRELNDQNSPLPRLPTELKLQIGKLILGPSDWDHWGPVGRIWFKQILPLLQTCTNLRMDLHQIRFENATLNCPYFPSDYGSWNYLRHMLAAWYRDGPHRGPVTIHINYFDAGIWANQTAHLSTIAALAGGLECMLFGRLSDPPALFISVYRAGNNVMSWTCEIAGTSIALHAEEILMGHGREKNMQACLRDEYLRREWRTLSVEDRAQIWEQARKEGWE